MSENRPEEASENFPRLSVAESRAGEKLRVKNTNSDLSDNAFVAFVDEDGKVRQELTAAFLNADHYEVIERVTE
jgi:hypothetical protein